MRLIDTYFWTIMSIVEKLHRFSSNEQARTRIKQELIDAGLEPVNNNRASSNGELEVLDRKEKTHTQGQMLDVEIYIRGFHPEIEEGQIITPKQGWSRDWETFIQRTEFPKIATIKVVKKEENNHK